jgi:HK97 family phage portal protein
MGFFDSIRNAFRKTRSSLIVRLGTQEVYSEVTVQKAIDRGFNENTAVYSIVMRDAQKFGTIPRYLYDSRELEEKAGEIFDHKELNSLLNRPNPKHSQDSFFTELRAYYKVCGEAFIWLNRGDTNVIDGNGQILPIDDEAHAKRPVIEMYVIPSNFVIVVPDEADLWGVKGYMLDLGGQRLPMRKVDVIHWKTVNLNFDAVGRTHQRGLPPLTPGYKTLQQNNDATNSAVRMYQNDGSKGILANETLDKITPRQQSQINEVIDAKINTNELKGAVAALQGKWEYINLGGSSVDLQLLEGKELSWKELCFLFEVPYEFFNSDTTFANKEQAQKGWVSNSILPACKQLDGELNRVLLKAFGLEKVAYISSDASELPEMQQDMSLLAIALNTAWWIVPNEAREAMGFERIEDPQFDEPWVVSGRTPLSQMNDQAEMEKITNELMNDQIGKDDA